MSASTAVVFPLIDGQRRTGVTARGILADALRQVDPVGAAAVERETQWRAHYPQHFRQIVQASLLSDDASVTIAEAGLASVHERMRWCPPGAPEAGDEPLSAALTTSADEPLESEYVRGEGEPETELTLPYRGERLRGDAIRRRLDAWAVSGVIEPSVGDAVGLVLENPEWLRLPGRTAVLIGAGAEMSPLRSLLWWGADVAAVDLPGAARWESILADSYRLAGSLRFPVQGDGDAAARAGADVLHDVGSVARWVSGLDSSLVLAGHVYADGADHVRLVTAVDVLDQHVYAERPDTALVAIGTPTDVYAVPPEAVAASISEYEASRSRRLLGEPLRLLSGGRLLARAYAPGGDPAAPGINDSIVPQQGPNYLLAKRIQRWRATADRAKGRRVSFHVAPPSRTRSVVRNRLFAAAYAGAGRFGVEVFDPSTAATLMAALLVHDLYADAPLGARAGADVAAVPAWQAESYAAVHGGLWRIPYEPRSALGLAAVTGLAVRR